MDGRGTAFSTVDHCVQVMLDARELSLARPSGLARGSDKSCLTNVKTIDGFDGRYQTIGTTLGGQAFNGF